MGIFSQKQMCFLEFYLLSIWLNLFKLQPSLKSFKCHLKNIMTFELTNQKLGVGVSKESEIKEIRHPKTSPGKAFLFANFYKILSQKTIFEFSFQSKFCLFNSFLQNNFKNICSEVISEDFVQQKLNQASKYL